MNPLFTDIQFTDIHNLGYLNAVEAFAFRFVTTPRLNDPPNETEAERHQCGIAVVLAIRAAQYEQPVAPTAQVEKLLALIEQAIQTIPSEYR